MNDSEQPVPECRHWIGAERRHCRSIDHIRRYLTGLCCPLHTPSALAGKPEPLPGPGLPAGAWVTPSPINESRIHDARAVASSKRRSTPHTYRAAQATVARRKDPQP